MFVRSVDRQIRWILRQVSSIIVFMLLLLLVLMNYTTNVFEYRGFDLVAMYHPMKLLSLSYNRVYYDANITLLIVELVPLVVVLPAGLSLSTERQLGEEPILVVRLGRGIYLWSKLIAVVVSTMIVFTVPFLIEIVLNCIAFPLEATGDLSNWTIYEEELFLSIKNYILPQLYIFSPYLYAVCGTIWFGVFSGILAGFTFAISSLVRVKYRVLLLLPVFLLLHLSTSFQSLRWYNYVLLFNDEPKNLARFFSVILAVLLLTVIQTACACKKDTLK